MSFTRKEWIFERCGWVFLFLIILAAAAGVFGTGLFSRVEVSTPDEGISISYSRSVRQESSELIAIDFHKPAEAREFAISDELMAVWQIESITPEPESAVAEAQRTLYKFHGRGPGTIEIQYVSKAVGSVEGTFHFPPETSVRIEQFSLP